MLRNPSTLALHQYPLEFCVWILGCFVCRHEVFRARIHHKLPTMFCKPGWTSEDMHALLCCFLSVLKLAVPWNETYPDTAKLGKRPSGAYEGCLAHHVPPVLCGLAETPAFLMAKQLSALQWEDCGTWPPSLPLCTLFLSGKTTWAAKP